MTANLSGGISLESPLALNMCVPAAGGRDGRIWEQGWVVPQGEGI